MAGIIRLQLDVSVQIKFAGKDHKTGAHVLTNTGDGKQGSESRLRGSDRIERAVGGADKEALNIRDVGCWIA